MVKRYEDEDESPARGAADLTFVPAERRSIVKARIYEIENYVSRTSSSSADAVLAAGRLGIGVSTFYRLVRTWKANRDPRRLAGSGVKTKRFETKPLGDEDFIRETLAGLSSGGSVEKDVQTIATLAAERNIPLRSFSALRRAIRDQRPEYDRSSVPGDLVIARAAIDVPVEHGSFAAMPVGIVLAHVATDRILAIKLKSETAGPRDFAEVFLSALETGALAESGQGARSIVLGGAGDEDQAELKSVLAWAGVSSPDELPRGRMAANEWVARRLRSIGLKGHPRFAHQPPEKRILEPKSPLDAPIAMARAQAILTDRIAATFDGPPVAIAVDGQELASKLIAFLGPTTRY
jgi:hypothetical protein